MAVRGNFSKGDVDIHHVGRVKQLNVPADRMRRNGMELA